MQIVVLDGFTLNPGDLSWERFRSLGDLKVYDRTPPTETVERARDAEVVLTNKTVLSKEVIERLPRLRYIGVLATGYNNVDLEAAADQNVAVANVPEYSTQSVAQMVFAHILNLTNHVAAHSASVHNGKWSRSKDFCFCDYPQIELDGHTLGIVGLGRIGKAVAKIGDAMGMRILAANRSTPAEMPPYVDLTDREDLFRRSDIVSLHCPLTEDSRHMVDEAALRTMKRNAFLVNTSRGPLIDEHALADALKNKVIARAAVDVLSVEPPPLENPLLHVDDCHITPHIAWATKAARERLMAQAFENVASYLQGKRKNVVNANLLVEKDN